MITAARTAAEVPLSAPRRRRAAAVQSKARTSSFSIIVPVLNEAALIEPFLAQLRQRAPGAEVIVVDGGSSDGTAPCAREGADEVITAPRCRALQMNAGAALAGGDVLWFLHVDAEIPPDSLEHIAQVLADPRVAGGFFRIRLPADRVIYRLTDSFAHYAGLLLRLRCGDHGIFCRREVFAAIGGYREVPLMEDMEFFRALHRHGAVRAVRGSALQANPRRYETIGRLRLTLAYGLLASLYALRVPIPVLTSIYRRTCCRKENA